MNIGAQICVADQSGELFTSIVELRVERYVQIAGVHQGTGLFGLEEAANDARIAIEERRLIPGNAGASDASWYRRLNQSGLEAKHWRDPPPATSNRNRR